MHLFYSCKQNKMHVASEKVSIKKVDKCIIEKKGLLYLFFWDKTGDNSDHIMNTRNNSCQRATGSIPNEPSS